MKSVPLKAASLGGFLLLAIQLWSSSAAAAPVTFSAASLRGRWGFQMLPAKSFSASAPGDPGGVATAPRQDIMRVGVIEWDSAGSVVGNVFATTDDNTGNTVIINYAFTGSYTVDPNGYGTLSIAPNPIPDGNCTPAQPPGDCATFEGPETYSIAITRNRGVKMVQTDNAGGGAKIFMQGEALQQSKATFPPVYDVFDLGKTWSFTMGPAKSFAVNPPQVCPLVDPAGVATAPRQDILRVGRMSFDRFGGATGHTIATTDDNAGSTVVVEFDWAGTYTVNADGTGTLNITSPLVNDSSCTPAQPAGVCATFEGAETYSLVIIPKRGRVYFVQTDNVGGGAKIFMAGEANYQ